MRESKTGPPNYHFLSLLATKNCIVTAKQRFEYEYHAISFEYEVFTISIYPMENFCTQASSGKVS